MQISDGIITKGFIIYRLCGYFSLSISFSFSLTLHLPFFLPFLMSFVAIIYKTQKMRSRKMHFLFLFNCVYTELCHLFPNIAIPLLRPGGATASERAEEERTDGGDCQFGVCVCLRACVHVCKRAREKTSYLLHFHPAVCFPHI